MNINLFVHSTYFELGIFIQNYYGTLHSYPKHFSDKCIPCFLDKTFCSDPKICYAPNCKHKTKLIILVQMAFHTFPSTFFFTLQFIIHISLLSRI